MNLREGVIIAVNKPYGMSSFGALARVRYLLSQHVGYKVKIGHAGTLDPLATGVLVLCTGKATKRIESLQEHTKQYLATLQLGATTPSYDREHDIDARFETSHITREMIDTTLLQFTGNIMQVPPAYSACKVNGDRAYELQRKGRVVELQAKPIRIDEILLEDFDAGQMTLRIRVTCGKGTYIRALARDIGSALGSGAYLLSLCRTRSGSISLDDCIDFDRFPEWIAENEIE